MNQGKKLVLLSFSVTYRLESTRNVQKNIATLLQWFCWGLGDHDFFDIATVEVLNDILRPMTMKLLDGDKKVDSEAAPQRRNCQGIYQSCNCENLDAQISSCIVTDLSAFLMEEVNSGKSYHM